MSDSTAMLGNGIDYYLCGQRVTEAQYLAAVEAAHFRRTPASFTVGHTTGHMVFNSPPPGQEELDELDANNR